MMAYEGSKENKVIDVMMFGPLAFIRHEKGKIKSKRHHVLVFVTFLAFWYHMHIFLYYRL